MSDQESTANDRESEASLALILGEVQEGRRLAAHEHMRAVKRLERLAQDIAQLGDRIAAIDQLAHNPFAAFLPADLQSRVCTHTQPDGTISLQLSTVQPQTQTQPVLDQQASEAAIQDAPPNDEGQQGTTAQNRGNPDRQKAIRENASKLAKAALADKKKVKPSYTSSYGAGHRFLPESPPKIRNARPSKRSVKKSAARNDGEEVSDSAPDSIPAFAEPEELDKKKTKGQRMTKRTRKTRDAGADEAGSAVLGDNDATESPV